MASSTEPIPSAPGAMSGVPSRIESTKFWISVQWAFGALSKGISTFQTSGLAKPLLEALENSTISASLRVKWILLFSRTTLPRVPQSSKRLVPGASPVEEMKTPVAPLAHSR